MVIFALLTLAGLAALAGAAWHAHSRQRRSERKDLNERLAILTAENARLMHMVEFDDLTEARSRRYLRGLFARTAQDGSNAMVFIDLDEFKSVNDGFGHRAGDSFLRRIAETLRAECREGETLFRHGGDEFCIYMRQVDNAQALQRAADFVAAVGGTSLEVDGVWIRRTASAGVTRIDTGQDMMGALYYADEALYAAKQAGGNCVRVTEGETLKTMIARRTGPRAEDLAEAVRRDEITYFVQPVFDTLAGRAIGVEALIRWVRSDGNVLLPEKFIGVTRGNFHREMTPPVQVAAEAVKAFAGSTEDIYCAFNVSSRFLERSIEDNLDYTAALSSWAEPSHIVFELVEDAVIRNSGKTRELLQELRGRGVRIALDDFGTGLSNMERLQELDIDIVKIDRRFVQGTGDTPADPGILRAVHEMSRDMGFQVIAEGVETEQQLRTLQKIGIFNAQGYLLGRPERVSYWQHRLTEPLPSRFHVQQSA